MKYNFFLAVTPSDTVDFSPFAQRSGRLTDALYVGVTGDVAVVQKNGTAVIFTAVPAGKTLPVECRRVNATSTTATNLVALYAV